MFLNFCKHTQEDFTMERGQDVREAMALEGKGTVCLCFYLSVHISIEKIVIIIMTVYESLHNTEGGRGYCNLEIGPS